MDGVNILPRDSIGRRFVADMYLKSGEDEYARRDEQARPPAGGWRPLRSEEVERLVKNNNYADDWDLILVSDPFDTDRVKNSRFYGLVRIGRVRDAILEYHDLQLPVGITNSLIISSDVGDDCAVHDVSYLSHYIIGERCILFNLDEMHTTDHAKFGNGILKEGESESVRVWLDVMNETGCRGVLPFDGLTPGDAFLWAKYRDDTPLMAAFKRMTQDRFDARRGFYGTVGDQSVIKNSRILKDVKVGSRCYIKGANKLKNLTINSSAEEPSQIGEGVELVNGIIGYGCRIFYGCKAVRFVLGNNSNLKYGARLINSYLGDNSTISCCEVLNNLIFPAHEQHHNNSFLIASVVMGQSNIAAGATIGSNHNSRANDNEILAGRGFWPGLCTSLKHSCRFASFVLLSKADYPAELDIPFPFTLINNRPSADRLDVLPAFWWLHNMYALARNTWKFHHRDKRVRKTQHIEFEALAPDTVEEIFTAQALLRQWTAKAACRTRGMSEAEIAALDPQRLDAIGERLLTGLGEARGERGVDCAPFETKELAAIDADQLHVLGEGMEKSAREVLIVRPRRAYRAYSQMVHYYAALNVLDYLEAHPHIGAADLPRTLGADSGVEPAHTWVNVGGQLVPCADVDRLRAEVASGVVSDWDAVHRRYDELWAQYPLQKQRHAYDALRRLYGTAPSDPSALNQVLEEAKAIQRHVRDEVYRTRQKDFENPFRFKTYRNEAEMRAAIGTIEDNEFVRLVRSQTEALCDRIASIAKRL